MRLLALELTSDVNSIALVQHTMPLAVDSWETAHLRRQQAFTRTAHLLAQHDTTIKQLDAIAVDTGPGSYFGLRVAYTYAKGLAFPHGIPVTGATSCEILAWEWFSSDHVGPFVSLHDIRRGHLAIARFDSVESLLTSSTPDIRVIAPSDIEAAIPTGCTVGTPDWTRLDAILLPMRARVHIHEGPRCPSALALAGLIDARARAGQPLQAVSLQYIHPPVAETTRRIASV